MQNARNVRLGWVTTSGAAALGGEPPPPPSGEGPGASEAADPCATSTRSCASTCWRVLGRARRVRRRARRGPGVRPGRPRGGAHLRRHVPRLDAVGLTRTLGLLYRCRYFSRLDASFAPATAELETSIARLFVVTAAKARRKDKIAELFEAEGERLVAAGGDHELYRWFAVPYVKRPSSDPRFAPYFEGQMGGRRRRERQEFPLRRVAAAPPNPSCSAGAAARRERARPRIARRRARAGGGAVTRSVPRRGRPSTRLGPRAARRRPSRRRCTAPRPAIRKRAAAIPKRAFGVESAFDSDKSAFDSSFELPPSGPHRDKIETRNAVTAVTFTRQDAFSLHAPRPVAHALSPGGSLVAGAGDDGAVRVWSVDDEMRDDLAGNLGGEAFRENHNDSTTSVLASLHVGENAVGALAWDVDAFNRNARQGPRRRAVCVGGATPPCAPGTWTSAPGTGRGGDESFPHREDLRCSPCGRWPRERGDAGTWRRRGARR